MVYNIYFDVAGLFVNVVLILLACLRKTPPRTRNTIFRLMLFSNLFATIFDILSAYTVSFPQDYTIFQHYFRALMYYFFHNLSAALYLNYGLQTDEKRKNNRKIQNIIKIVFVIVYLCIFTTPFTKLVFYFDDNFIYHQGPMLYVLYAIGLLSVIFVLYLKLTSKEEQSRFQIVTNVSYAVALFFAFLYHTLHNSVLIELFAIDLGYLVMFISLDNPEQYFYKTFSTYNRLAFEQYVHHIVHQNRKFNILILAPKNIEFYKKQFSSKEIFTMNKNIIDTITGKKRNDRFFVLSDLCFAYIIDDYESEIDRINHKLEKPILVNNTEYYVDMSYAILRFPEIAKNNNDLFILLDDLLHRISTQVSSAPLEANPNVLLTENRKGIEDTLIKAIKNDKFYIEYEPIFDSNGSDALNAEAYLMIKTEKSSIQMTSEYFEIAESDGLVIDIDEISLKKVGEFINKSNISNLGINNIILNLSIKELMSIHFVDRIKEIISKYKLPSDHICFKLIDLDLSSNSDVIIKNMNDVHDLGFKFVVDKYGENSVNLINLINLPIIGVKISEKLIKEAVNNKQKKIILNNLVHLLKKLKYYVACSDITNDLEDKLVKSMKFDFFQGPYYGKRMKDDKFIKFYRDQLYSILTLINRN